ncbi:MAG TPA: protein kinase [Gemmataceae bacterium]|nr:protein kinase [Gemmataceae bacterium]
MSTPSALTAPHLLQILRGQQLADPERLSAVLRQLPPGVAEGSDSKALADALVAAQVVTKFQASLLLQGKSRSLMIAGKYRLVDRLGAGGMGLVYLCEHVKMRRPVAVKVLPHKQAAEPGQLDRFLREAQAAAALKHPNIVQAFDIDQDNGVHYMVMEFVDGVDLERLVGKIGPLEAHRAAHYIAQAAEGLDHASERGLVHRDIKPSNLLVDREGTVKVLDLGLARLSKGGESVTQRYDANTVIGTADYISPEQALDSHEVDVRADIYSLGCTFYFLLAGRAPFKDANVTQKLLMHQMRDPTPITELREDVPGLMGAVLARMMAKEPSARYQTPADVVDALAPWTQNAPAPPTEAEIPPRMFGTTSPSGSSLNFRSQSTSTLPRPGTRIETMTGRRSRTFLPGRARPGGAGRRKAIAAVAGGVLGAGILVGLVAWRPWAATEDTPDTTNDQHTAAKSGPPPVTPVAKVTPAGPVRVGNGFSFVGLEGATPPPIVENNEVRDTFTDVYYILGNLSRNLPADKEILGVFRRDAVGRAGGRVVPYVVTALDAGFPNTLVGFNEKDVLRAIPEAEYLPATRVRDAGPEHNLLLRGAVLLKPGLTEINALVTDLGDVAAGPGGSTLRVHSGAVLSAGSAGPSSTFGAGPDPLNLDFAGHTGYLTLSSDQDFTRVKGGREHLVRARLTGLGESPLVVSGMWGTVIRFTNPDNDFPRLVVQGLSLVGGPPDKVFRLNFSDDRQLGRTGGPITLADAHLSYTGDESPAINRSLTLPGNRAGRVSVNERTRGAGLTVRWSGKVTGAGRLVKAGNGTLVLTSEENDYTGGTEVAGGLLTLQTTGGTPVGTGAVVISSGTLGGAGDVPGGLTVRPGGMLQPGEAGKPIQVGGALALQRGKVPGQNGDFSSTLLLRPGGAGTAKLLIYTGTAPVDLSPAALKVTPLASFQPKPDAVVPVIVSQGAEIRGTFQSLAPDARVVTTDGKWTAKISYQGDAKSGVTAGGRDVVLYDWKQAGK